MVGVLPLCQAWTITITITSTSTTTTMWAAMLWDNSFKSEDHPTQSMESSTSQVNNMMDLMCINLKIRRLICIIMYVCVCVCAVLYRNEKNANKLFLSLRTLLALLAQLFDLFFVLVCLLCVLSARVRWVPCQCLVVFFLLCCCCMVLSFVFVFILFCFWFDFDLVWIGRDQ